MKSGKNACSADLHMVFIRKVGFVWRQLELAFFGAVTSVAALFVFTERFSHIQGGQNVKQIQNHYWIVATSFRKYTCVKRLWQQRVSYSSI